LLAIPLFEESHSSKSLYAFCSKVLDALCPTWKERIIGLSTDGAPNMMDAMWDLQQDLQMLQAMIMHSIRCGV
jgi:hypothetical protein